MNKALIFLSLLILSLPCIAERPVFLIIIENNLFYPSELVVPVNKKIKLVIHNKDQTPEEFDSFDLNREKVIFPNSKGNLYIGPLIEGEYHYFGEYHPSSAIGKIIAKGETNAH